MPEDNVERLREEVRSQTTLCMARSKVITKVETTMEFMKKELNEIKNLVKDVKSDIKDNDKEYWKSFATKHEVDLRLDPIKRLVYGSTAVILIAVLSNIVYQALKN